MSKTKRLVGLLVALVVVAGLVAGVAFWSLGFGGSNAQTALYVDGKKVDEPGSIVTIGTQDIDFGVYNYYYQNLKQGLSNGDDSYWDHDTDGTRATSLIDTVEEYLRYYYAWVEVADLYGIELSQEEVDELDAEIQALKDAYGTEFDAVLQADHFIDEESFRAVNLMQILINKAMAEVEELIIEANRDEILAGLMTVKHILVTESYFIDETEEDVEAGETPRTRMQQAEAFAYEMLDMIHESSDPEAQFEEFRYLYSEDGGQGEDGYTFGAGVMVESFYEGAKALAIGEFSDPIPSDYGYHIIYRLPLDMDAVGDDLYSAAPTEVEALINEVFESVYDNLTITPGTYYNDIGTSNIK